jgi:hypothetical protein
MRNMASYLSSADWLRTNVPLWDMIYLPRLAAPIFVASGHFDRHFDGAHGAELAALPYHPSQGWLERENASKGRGCALVCITSSCAGGSSADMEGRVSMLTIRASGSNEAPTANKHMPFYKSRSAERASCAIQQR